MGKIDSNKEQKQTSLLNTAFELFTTKGESKTSIADIVQRAGVAKGTFYLYFKDKYDIRNRLIARKSSQLFRNASIALESESIPMFEDKIIFLIDNIINQLNTNQELLHFISKNLSWGIFKNALVCTESKDDVNFQSLYYRMISEEDVKFKDPEVMLFMIVELVSSTCYSSIMYREPVPLEQLKPQLYRVIRMVIHDHELTAEATTEPNEA